MFFPASVTKYTTT